MRKMSLAKVKQVVIGNTVNLKKRPSKYTCDSKLPNLPLTGYVTLDLSEPKFPLLKIGNSHHTYLIEWLHIWNLILYIKILVKYTQSQKY